MAAPVEVIDRSEATELGRGELDVYAQSLVASEKFITDNTDQAVQVMRDRFLQDKDEFPSDEAYFQAEYLASIALYAVEAEALGRIDQKTSKRERNDVIRATALALSELVGYTPEDFSFASGHFDQFGNPIPAGKVGQSREYQEGTLTASADQSMWGSFTRKFKDRGPVTAAVAGAGVAVIAESLVTGGLAAAAIYGLSRVGDTKEPLRDLASEYEKNPRIRPIQPLAYLIEDPAYTWDTTNIAVHGSLWWKEQVPDRATSPVKLQLWRTVLQVTADYRLKEALSDQNTIQGYSYNNPFTLKLKRWLDSQKGRLVRLSDVQAEIPALRAAGQATQIEWPKVKGLRERCSTFIKGYDRFAQLMPGFNSGSPAGDKVKKEFEIWRAWNGVMIPSRDEVNFNAMVTSSQTLAKKMVIARITALGSSHAGLLIAANAIPVPQNDWNGLIKMAEKLPRPVLPESVGDWKSAASARRNTLLGAVSAYRGTYHADRTKLIIDLTNFDVNNYTTAAQAKAVLDGYAARWDKIQKP